MPRLTREIAQAVLLPKGEKENAPAQTHSGLLVTVAKRLERLQAARRKLRRELRRVEKEIRTERRMLKAIQRELTR